MINTSPFCACPLLIELWPTSKGGADRAKPLVYFVDLGGGAAARSGVAWRHKKHKRSALTSAYSARIRRPPTRALADSTRTRTLAAVSARGGSVIAADLIRIILAAQRDRLTRPVAIATSTVAANHAIRPQVRAESVRSR